MASQSDGKGNFARMQHLIDEMDASNHRIDLFSKKYDNGLDKYSTSPPTKPSATDRQFEALYDDAWKSEESDGASLQEVPIHNISCNDEGDSGCEEVVNNAIAEVSNDFLSGLRQSAVQGQYADSDESKISSDNDFKLLTGMPSYARYPETGTGLSDTDWNPYGTESDNNQSPHLPSSQDKGSESKSSVLSSFTPLMNSTDINAVTPNTPVKVSRFNEDRMSNILEKTERDSTLSHTLISNNTNRIPETLYTPKAIERKPQQLSDFNQNNNEYGKDPHISKETVSSDEEKKMIASTSSTGYSSATSGTINTALSSKPLSVIERAKLMGIPEDILLDKNSKSTLSRTRVFQLKHSSGPDEDGSDDQLAKKVRALLSDTSHLSMYDKVNTGTGNSSSVDYTVLQRDLQEIQDNLDKFDTVQGIGNKDGRGTCKSPVSSEGDIIPSTTTTPERRKEKMLWDFAGDIGCYGDQQGVGLMEEISLDTRTTHSRPSTEKTLYNSDGDETRTSGSSAKVEDHAAADQALAEMSEVLPPSMRNLDSSSDVDRMVSTFQSQRRQLESRYQQLNNQGLADKVFRILTNQNPESQANGILSEISADEKDMRTRMVLSIHDKNFNYSSTSSWLEDQNQSCEPQYDVRKKLDMSGLSSVDSSLALDRSATKGFSALDDAKRFLSSQMMKMSEKTFNHSYELRVPQTIHCYPLLSGGVGEGKNRQESDPEKKDERQKKESDAPDQGSEEDSAVKTKQEGSDESNSHKNSDTARQDYAGEAAKTNTSPISFDQGSGTRPKDKYRPYRPPGSKEVYYTESDTASVADSVTTMESTHIGSDDAKGPHLPSNLLGSRKDLPNVTGIYSSHKNLSTVREDTELTVIDEKSENNSEVKNYSRRETSTSPNTVLSDMNKRGMGGESESYSAYRPRTRSPTTRFGRNECGIETVGGRLHDVRTRDNAHSDAWKQKERQANVSSAHGVAAARRDARWAHRRDEIELSGDGSGNNPESYRASDRIGINSRFDDVKSQSRTGHSDDGGERGRRDDYETEPLSLMIQMTYTDENKCVEKDQRNRGRALERQDLRQRQHLSELEQINNRQEERFSQRDKGQFGRHSPEPRHQHGTEHNIASDDHFNSIDTHLSPALRHVTYSDRHDGLTRAASDENLNATMRDARLSPAFRRALSPEFRSTIERRSPILSHYLERSLAQPPSDYPSGNKRYGDNATDVRNAPPTFLARERAVSPTEYRRHLIKDKMETWSPNRGENTRPRPRSVSPSFVDRNGSALRYKSPNERESLATKMDDTNNYRVSVIQNQPTTKTKRKVELTLEGMSSESEADLEMDQEPLSKRAQLLKAALVSEPEPFEMRNPCGKEDLNTMWERFKAMNESSGSSINSTKIEAVSDLLKSPTRHLVSQYVKDREEYRIERQERAEMERERRLKEQESHKHSSSEDEISQRYAELLAVKEEERMRRRASKKKKGKVVTSLTGPEKKNEKDSLFSIPEDRSHEPSPVKSPFPSKRHKPKAASQTHVIDPNMTKLRDRIAKQKTKVDKDMLKELQRIDKLQKLENLLIAKKKGKISNETLENQLEELSSTSAIASEFSHESGTDCLSARQGNSDDSTTAKDSSAEMHAWKAEKERRKKEFEKNQLAQAKKSVKDKTDNCDTKRWLMRGKKSPDISEIRLLKLVKEGYLTPNEAYQVALDRAAGASDSHYNLDISRDSVNSDNSFNGKPHKLYSPYSRSSNHKTQTRRIPKLKFPHSSYGLDDSEADQQPSTKSDQELWPRHRSEKGVKGRSSSQTKFSPNRREKSYSPITTRRASPSTSGRHSSASPQGRMESKCGQHYSRKAMQIVSHHKGYACENDAPGTNEDHSMRSSVAWHIPMDVPSSQWKEPASQLQPFREVTSSITNKPRKEKHVDLVQRARMMTGDRREKSKSKEMDPANIWTKSNHPRGIPKLQWEQVVSKDALATKTNHWEVDPTMDRVQYILNRHPTSFGDVSQRSFASEEGSAYGKPVSKMSLQDAFLMQKQTFISKCSQRQKRLKLAKENRQLQECLRLEREAIFAEQDRLAPPNLYAHPYSDNLYQPKLRVLTKQEMKGLTARRYNKLPEVVEKKEENKKQIEAKLNRLRANLFNKKVQRDVLRQTLKQRCGHY